MFFLLPIFPPLVHNGPLQPVVEILFSLELNLRAIKMTNHFPIENFEHFYELRMKL